MNKEENNIIDVDILNESKDAFLTYAEEVLTDRAIPSAEDGLLSAQRKILWTMEDYLKMNEKSKTKKCNAIVGSTLATSYFHGDQACYGVLCKMAQNYLIRYPLITGQGSLGTQEDNDMVASSRYTEAKPSEFADLMFNDFKKNVVPTKETYNGEYQEPVVLPALFPNAICNGKVAIGISMSHCSAPHNLTEACNAIIAYINNPNMTIDELLKIMPGPDFPLDNIVINKKDIKQAFATGKSNVSLKIRGAYTIEENKIIFTSIPYRTYRNKIKAQIEKNAEELDKYISDFDDESGLGNNRLVFYVRAGVAPKAAVDKLFQLTDLQSSISYNMNYIVNGTPKMCSMLDLIDNYVKHQDNVLVRATQYDLDKTERRLHILEGLLIIIKDIDKAIELIKTSSNKAEANNKLIKEFGLTEMQADAVLDLKLVRLTKLDTNELKGEYTEKQNLAKEYHKILENTEYRNSILIKKVTEMRDKYGDARRTQLIDLKEDDTESADIIPDKVMVTLTKSGMIKRTSIASFKTKRKKTAKSDDDIVIDTIRTNTVDSLMIFTNRGVMYRLTVNDIPDGDKPTSVHSLVKMASNEYPEVIYSIYKDTDAKYVLFVTKNGLVKKTALDEFVTTKRKTGIAAINLREGDSLASVSLIKEEPLILVTKNGMVIKFASTEIAATGRATAGVKGIDLKKDDYVVTGLPLRNAADNLALFTSEGYGKQMEQSELVTQKRAGIGVVGYKATESSGYIVGAALITTGDNLLLVKNVKSVCVKSEDIPILKRISAGNLLAKGGIQSVSKI